MNEKEIKAMIMKELPHIIKTDEEVRQFILNLGREQFADRDESNRRFNRIMDELAEQRIQSDKRWEEHRNEHREILAEIKSLHHKHESTIGALGARWGLYSEQSFRNALKGILEDLFDVEVISVNEYDDDGYVFGRPDQVELDIIVKDGILIICELKSSIDKAGMYIFERKVRFYEKKHQRQASKMIVVSPMVDDRAKVVAEKLGVEVYTHAENVEEI